MTQVVVTIVFVILLLITCLAGWTWLELFSFCCRREHNSRQTGPAHAFLMGTAMLGLLGYLLLGVFGRITPLTYWLLFGLQWVLAIPGLWLASRWWQRQKRWSWPLGILFLIWAGVLAAYAGQLPLLGYDARAIYGLKGKILANGASVWGADFRDPYRLHFGSNYPLLIPIVESFFFQIRFLFDSRNPWSDSGLPLLFWAFVVAGTALVAEGSQRFANGWGFFAGFIWALTPIVWRWTEGAGLSGSVDIPFAVFTAAAVICTADGWATRNCAQLLLGGIYFGTSTLIKQEGNIALGIMIVAVFVTIFYQRICGKPTQQTSRLTHHLVPSFPMMAIFLAGLIPFLAISRWIHAAMPQQVYMRSYLSAISWEWLAQIGDRPLVVLSFALKEFTGNHWGAVWFYLAFTLLMRRKRPVEVPLQFLRTFLLLLLMSYLGILVITPYPLAYHLHTAWARLVSHVLPLVVVVLVEQLAATEWFADMNAAIAEYSDGGQRTIHDHPADGQNFLQNPRSGVSDSEKAGG